MSRKTSVYVDRAGEAIVTARDFERETAAIKRHGRRSLLFREMLRRYDEICRTDLPDLTEIEWNALVEAGESWRLDDIDSGVRFGRLITAAGRNERLLKKLFDLGQAHRIAIVDYIERYWAAKARHEAAPPLPVREASRDRERVRAGGKSK
jgi:hypothetical protein